MRGSRNAVKKNTRVRKNISSPESPVRERVVLKPVFGVPPRTYVPVLYGALLLCAAFFLLVFPGLWNPGARLSFQVRPEGASVIVDGVRLGFAPGEYFVPRGNRKVLIRKPHFAPRELEVAVPRRLLGSLFFPKRMTLSVELEPASPKELLASAHEEFSRRALSDPASSQWAPATLSEAAADYASSPAGDPAALREMLRSAAASVDSPGALEDYVRAVFLADSGGGALSPQSLVRSAHFLLDLYLAAGDGAPDWLSRVLPEKAAAAYAAKKEARSVPQAGKSGPAAGLPEPSYIHTPGGEFARIPGGFLRPGGGGASAGATVGPGASGSSRGGDSASGASRPEGLGIDTFYLKTHLVTEAEFALFIREDPLWAPAGRDRLVREGLAEDSYLASWGDSPRPPSPDLPVREVSHPAAEAYCRWLTGKDPAYRYFLPAEWAWEYAAALNLGQGTPAPGTSGLQPAAAAPRGRLGLRSMLGGLWEWCADGYYPAAPVFLPSGDYPVAEMSVRGGSWLNPPGTVRPATRGSQPPAWCTPYLGFRPAAARKTAER